MSNRVQIRGLKDSNSELGVNVLAKDKLDVIDGLSLFQRESQNKYKGSVIVVDDQATGRKILAELLQQLDLTLKVSCFSDPVEALTSINSDTPDLILTDYRMPVMDGVEFTKHVRGIKKCRDVPLVVITGCEDLQVRYKALGAGATDFIIRPIDQYECQARFRNLLTLRKQQQIIKNRASWFEDQVAVVTDQIWVREKEALARLAKVGEYRIDNTEEHIFRVAKFSRLIAEGLGLHESMCHEIEIAAPLHDLGNVGIPDRILLKAEILSSEERNVLKTHTTLGYEMLKGCDSKYMKLASLIALNHHEKFDGTGYPFGTRGEDIPLAARVVAVADVFDAISSSRSYRMAMSLEDSMQYLKSESGRHFDPCCVEAFFKQEASIRSLLSGRRVTDL